MIEKEKLEELKRNSELVLELIEMIQDLSKELDDARKEKSHYLSEYKRVCDEKHKLEVQTKNSKEGQG